MLQAMQEELADVLPLYRDAVNRLGSEASRETFQIRGVILSENTR